MCATVLTSNNVCCIHVVRLRVVYPDHAKLQMQYTMYESTHKQGEYGCSPTVLNITFIPYEEEIYNCDCGKHSITDHYAVARVFNGTVHPRNRYPWQLYMTIYDDVCEQFHSCGAVLISRRHILELP